MRSGTPTGAAARPTLDTSGWVMAPPFYAAGDEPYWRMDVSDGWFVFQRSGLPSIEAPLVAPTKGAGGADVFKTPPLEVQISAAACETDEGVAGKASVLVTLDGVPFDGCAFDSTPASADGDDIEAEDLATLTDAIQEIDACLAKLGEPALITAVYPRQPGVTAMAMRNRTGALFECGATDAGEVLFLDPVEPGAAGAWLTARMRFLRAASGQVPDAAKACADAKEVHAPAGGPPLGYLLKAKCKL